MEMPVSKIVSCLLMASVLVAAPGVYAGAQTVEAGQPAAAEEIVVSFEIPKLIQKDILDRQTYHNGMDL